MLPINHISLTLLRSRTICGWCIDCAWRSDSNAVDIIDSAFFENSGESLPLAPLIDSHIYRFRYAYRCYQPGRYGTCQNCDCYFRPIHPTIPLPRGVSR